MNITEINAKSLLRKHKRIDSWFAARYGMNLYRGCSHNCVYCDGRDERYFIDGEFGKDIMVKRNAPELLRNELNPARKRIPIKKGYFMIGGGVSDSYQPIEEKYKITKSVLEIINSYNYPVHILTKSTLVLRDLDLLKENNENNKTIVSFSFSSVDDDTSKIFEPNVAAPSEKLEVIKKIKSKGITCGMYLMPVIPFVTDTKEMITASVKKAKEIGIDFIIFGGLTLKTGIQKNYFLNILNKFYPHLLCEYDMIYQNDKWGNASDEYYHSINQIFFSVASEYKMKIRIPIEIIDGYIDENDKVIFILDCIDYYTKIRNKKSPFGYAAYSLSKINEPLSSIRKNIDKINGVGALTKKIICEIIDTGKSTYLEKLQIN
ncbi:MAG: radical SAM protein [Ignavibacteriales bacterium]|nr:radical SAM protein [Ignavibacteriales bacterium]